MRPADEKSYVISMRPPRRCAAFPVVDGWRCRPLSPLDSLGPDEEEYICGKYHSMIVRAFSDQKKRAAEHHLKVIAEWRNLTCVLWLVIFATYLLTAFGVL